MVLVTIKYAVPGTQPPIYIAGSFSNPEWQPLEMQFTTDENNEHEFSKDVELEEGKEYQYKLRIGDGDWWVLDERKPTVTDGSGNQNNCITIPLQQKPEEELVETKQASTSLSLSEKPQSTSKQPAEAVTNGHAAAPGVGNGQYDGILDDPEIESPLSAETGGLTPSGSSIEDEQHTKQSKVSAANGSPKPEDFNTQGPLIGKSDQHQEEGSAMEEESELNVPEEESITQSRPVESGGSIETANEIETETTARPSETLGNGFPQDDSESRKSKESVTVDSGDVPIKTDEETDAGTFQDDIKSRDGDDQVIASNSDTIGHGIGKQTDQIGASQVDSSLHQSFDGTSADAQATPPTVIGTRQLEDDVSHVQEIQTEEDNPKIVILPATPGAERNLTPASSKNLKPATSTAIKDDDATSQLRRRGVLESERAVSPGSMHTLGKDPRPKNFFKVFIHLVFVDWVGKWIKKIWAGLRRQPPNE